MSLKHRRIAFTIRLLLLASIVPLAACKKSESPEKPSVSVFASPDEAANALIAAAQMIDRMLQNGDEEGRLVWLRIRRAVEALQAGPRGPLH